MVSRGLRPVVVFDDSEEDLFILKRLLEKGGVTDPVLPFCDSAEAIQYLGRVASGGLDRPLLCFLDIKMPGYTGFDILEAIRASDVFDTVPAIMLSSSDDRRDIVKSADKGAQGYLVKHPRRKCFAVSSRRRVFIGDRLGQFRVQALRSKRICCADALPKIG